MTTRIGHLSDIHVPDLSDMRARDLASKRLTGWLNFKLKREKEYVPAVLDAAVQRLIDAKVDLVLISGDLSNLAYVAEFERARNHLTPLTSAGIPWLVVPGNHDRYLASAVDGRMERTFADALGEPLRDGDAYPYLSDQPGCVVIGLNSAVPNAPFMAWGEVGEAQRNAVRVNAARIRAIGKPVVLMVHHHIGKAPHKKNDTNRNLRDSDAVFALAQQIGACLILHGHNHYLDVRDIDGIRVFAASSGISSRATTHRKAGQVAIHTVAPNAAPTHEVAFWQGDAFGPWIAITPTSEIPVDPPLPA